MLAIVTLATGVEMLRYPVAHAGRVILLIEFMATISIGVTIAALLIGLQPTTRSVFSPQSHGDS
jgi:hypothetical protein